MVSPSINKADKICAAAVSAWAVACRHCDSFVEKEKRGPVATLHHGPFATLPIKRATYPGLMRPSGSAKGLVIAVNNPAIADEITARGIGNDVTSRLNAILKGHDRA
jgi:hypothetical protein